MNLDAPIAPSLQTVVGIPKGQKPWLAEFDLDRGNPLQDAQGVSVHLGELLNPGKTDHLDLWKSLSKDSTVDKFLHYNVVPA